MKTDRTITTQAVGIRKVKLFVKPPHGKFWKKLMQRLRLGDYS